MFSLKRSARAGRHKFMWGVLVITLPICILFSIVLSFFLFDSLNYYVLLIYTNNQQERKLKSQESLYGGDGWTEYGGESSDIIGSTGVKYMYVNKMSGGYYKENLEIVRDHCNWTQMHDGAEPVQQNGQMVYPSVATVLGMQLSEGGLESEGGARVSTVTPLSRLCYSTTDGKHSLATYNSAVCAADGGSTLSKPFNGSLNLYYHGSTAYRTQFQFSPYHAAIYPAGRYVEASGFWPSKMNGYGFSDGTVRTNADTDAAYYPDQISIALQRGWCTLGTASSGTRYNIDTINEYGLDIAMYASYGYGETGMAYQWGVGYKYRSNGYIGPFTIDGWSDKNTISYADSTSMSINFVAEAAETILRGLAEDYEGYTYGLWDNFESYRWANHPDYLGMAHASLLLSGCFVTPAKIDTIRSQASNSSYVRGATLAYRIFKNDKTATTDEVAEWLRTLQSKSVDTSIYPGFYDTTFHYIDTECMIYKDDGSGPYPALRSYSDDLRGMFMVHIGGVFVYWSMLKACGVECTFEDAYNDLHGKAIVEAQVPGANAGTGTSQSSMTMGERLARCMVSFSHPTTVSGEGNDGTPLYIKVHDFVDAGDSIYRSCDRGVMCAVRWAGADDNFPRGGCKEQLAYLDSGGGGHWVRVDWGGDRSKLQPGDIMIRSDWYRTGVDAGVGHIVMYCGWDIISEYHPNAKKNSMVSQASYDTRSPACGQWYDQLYTYEVYRIANPETNSRYINVIPYV